MGLWRGVIADNRGIPTPDFQRSCHASVSNRQMMMLTPPPFAASLPGQCLRTLAWVQRGLQAWLLLTLALAGTLVPAAVLDLAELPAQPLGQFADYYQEAPAQPPLTLAQAQHLYRQGQFRPGQAPVLSFGLGARPVWVRLAVRNPGLQAMSFRIGIGPSWLDRVSVDVVQQDRVQQSWSGGDAMPGALGVLPGLDMGWRTNLPPGESALWVRVQSLDPMQIALHLRTEAQLALAQTTRHYAYGALYGFLLALAAYNLALFAGLRHLRYLFYSLYLLCFIVANLSYTGHGFAWFWPQQPDVQRYAILAFMVFYGVMGFMFASRFLGLSKLMPRVQRGLQIYSVVAMLGMGLCVLTDSHLAAVYLAFGFVSTFSVLMLALGAYSMYAGLVASRYFFAAMLAGLVGSALTTLAVSGVIAFTPFNFHAVEFGLVLEATLLALALAQQFRLDQTQRLQAEFMAQHDALTSLYNRRAFFELGRSSWALAQRSGRALSVMMLDIDHFKAINDQFGHGMGDRVLVEISRTLANGCRAGDVLARWGGEEFIILLPETTLDDARQLAERIRQQVADSTAQVQQLHISFTVSIGVAQYGTESNLDALIDRADAHLYQAKRNGRNQVIAG